MQLTLNEAATRLGKTERQVQYLITTGKLPAKKRAGRWMIDADALELSDGQQQARERTQRQLRAAVEEGLNLSSDTRRARYSVRDINAFTICLPLHDQAVESLGAEHPVTVELRAVLEHLTQECHRYDFEQKAACYRDARDAASRALWP